MYDRSDFKWIVIGGSLLAVHAGYINTIAMRSVFAYTVGHITGLIVLSLASLINNNSVILWWDFLVIFFSFLFGAFLTGLICGTTQFKLQPRYGTILVLESILLFIAIGMFHGLNYPVNDSSRYGFVLVTIGIALQNAMFSTFSGAVVRTTHLTGMLNDGAMLCGQYLRYRFVSKKKATEMWKLKVYIPIVLGYSVGSALGSLIFDVIALDSLLVPAISLGLIGGTYLIGFQVYINCTGKHLTNRESTLENGDPKVSEPNQTPSKDVVVLDEIQ